jgi:hypothetical protein
MKRFCQNEHCDNPGAKVVPVSIDQPSDQKRTLCNTCEEAYSIGVQHGTMVASARPALPHLSRFIGNGGFVVLAHNKGDPSRHGPWEAWGYAGPLDLAVATPVTFGVGKNPLEAINALDVLLKDPSRPPARGTPSAGTALGAIQEHKE